MKIILFVGVFIVFFLLVFSLGAVTHELDLSRNFKEHKGDSKSWFFKIKCDHGGVK